MLVLEMEDVYCEANISKIGVMLNMLRNCAVVVKDNVIGHESSMVGPLDHFLHVVPQ